MKEITLIAGGTLIVDDNDYEIIKDRTWSYIKDISSNGDIYYCIYTRFKDGKRKSLHRFLFKDQKHVYVKHLNGNKFDYRRDNIVVNDFSHKSSRKSRPNMSKYKGVSYSPDVQKWSVMACKDRKRFYYSFDLEVKAAIAYNIIAKTFYGDKANLNEISPEDYEKYSDDVIPLLFWIVDGIWRRHQRRMKRDHCKITRKVVLKCQKYN